VHKYFDYIVSSDYILGVAQVIDITIECIPFPCLKRACHWILSWTRWIHFYLHTQFSLRPTLILSSCICLGLLSSLLPWYFLIKILHAFLFSSCLLCPSQPAWYGNHNDTLYVEKYKFCSSSVCSLLHSLITFSHLCSNVVKHFVLKHPQFLLVIWKNIWSI
jgi:hypothetical protein